MRTCRQAPLAWLAALGVLAAGGLVTRGVPAQAASVSVEIVDNAFVPETARVFMTEGEPSFPGLHAHVVFFNRDTVQHAPTFDDPRVQSSPPLGQFGTYDAVFNDPGTFSYHCSIHPGMTGTVVVTAPAVTTTTTTTTTTQPPSTAAPSTVPSATSTAPPASRTTAVRPATSTSIATTTTAVSATTSSTAPLVEATTSVPTSEPSTTTTTEPAPANNLAEAKSDGGGSAGRWPLLAFVAAAMAIGGAVLWRWRSRAAAPSLPPEVPDTED